MVEKGGILMFGMEDAHRWLEQLLNQPVHDSPLKYWFSYIATVLLGDWAIKPSMLLSLRLAIAAWFLIWALPAAVLYRKGYWKSGLGCFVIGFETAWAAMILSYAGLLQLPFFALHILPHMGWTFLVNSVLTGLLLWENGMSKMVVGLPRWVIGKMEKRGWAKYFFRKHLQN